MPDEEFHELRTLTRTRKQLVRDQTSHVQHIQKTLTEANIRLDSVISDIMGVNGRRMIEAMIEGVRDPGKLAALGDRRLKATRKELHDALHGRLTDHHRFLLKLHLDQHDALEKTIRVIDAEVERRIARLDKQAKPAETPLSRLIELLVSIPGVSYLSAITIISEIGTRKQEFVGVVDRLGRRRMRRAEARRVAPERLNADIGQREFRRRDAACEPSILSPRTNARLHRSMPAQTSSPAAR